MATHKTYNKGIVHYEVLLNAIGLSDPNPETTNSREVLIAGARGVGIQLTGTGITTRSAVMTVDVSMDGGTTYHDYSMIMSNTATTNSQTITRVASVTRNATGSDIMWLDPDTLAGVTHMKVTLVITDSGTPAGTFTVKTAITY